MLHDLREQRGLEYPSALVSTIAVPCGGAFHDGPSLYTGSRDSERGYTIEKELEGSLNIARTVQM